MIHDDIDWEYKGLAFGLIPVYLTENAADGYPAIKARNWFWEIPLDLVEGIYFALTCFMSEPAGMPIKITGEVSR